MNIFQKNDSNEAVLREDSLQHMCAYIGTSYLA